MNGCSGWESKIFETTLVSAGENADLMNPENRVFSEPLPHDSAWENADTIPGELEGNAVPAPDGNMVHLLRYGENKTRMPKNDAEHPHASAKFYCVLPFPMGHTKFEVRRHPIGTYYAGETCFRGEMFSPSTPPKIRKLGSITRINTGLSGNF